ncbi:MAG: hypothetical protein MHPSP_001853, partial [Paramarteilia canceri]
HSLQHKLFLLALRICEHSLSLSLIEKMYEDVKMKPYCSLEKEIESAIDEIKLKKVEGKLIKTPEQLERLKTKNKSRKKAAKKIAKTHSKRIRQISNKQSLNNLKTLKE